MADQPRSQKRVGSTSYSSSFLSPGISFLWVRRGGVNKKARDRCPVSFNYLDAVSVPLFPAHTLSLLFGFSEKSAKMGGGNGQKAKMAREKNLEKQKASKG